MTRLVSVGNALVDIVTTVPHLPERGGDVRGSAGGMTAGGGANVLVAAARQGLAAAYGGAHGTGFFGDVVRAALAAEGISVLLDPTPNRDTGYDIALVDCTGERSFVTAFGAEAELTAEQIGGLPLDADDLIHVSGYGLLPSTNGRVLGAFIVGLAPSHLVFVDPGPLVRDIDPAVWTTVVRRADWLSCNESEAAALTGATDARSAAGILSRSARNVLVRLGPDGCLLVSDGKVEHVQGFEVDAVDTTGAGDAHAGAFLAALAAGLSPRDAAQRANACAAIAVTRPGPATSPTLAEVLSFMR